MQENRLEVFLQPIVSIKNKKVFAFEALLRAYDDNGEMISPMWLFNQAKKENLSFMLDETSRILAIEKFKSYFDANPNLLLFLNFESSSIGQNFDMRRYTFKNRLQELGIPSKNIILEVKEDEIPNTDALEGFCRYHKCLGFGIALDDFGTGSSSFDRLSLIMPAVVKVDRSIIHNLQKNYINAEILKAIYKISEKIGAIVLAEGVESRMEALSCMHSGVDLYQGFWFAKPGRDFSDCQLISQKIEELAESFLKDRHLLRAYQASVFEQADKLTDKLLQVCIEGSPDNRIRLAQVVKNEKNVEAVYLIDSQTSKQVGETIMNVSPKGFYQPSMEGEDHSLKEYVYMPKLSRDAAHLTSSYISGASGNMCYTFSKKLMINQKEMIICVDIYEDTWKETSFPEQEAG